MEAFENGGTFPLLVQPIFEKIMLSKRKEGALWEKKVSSTFIKSLTSKVEFTS